MDRSSERRAVIEAHLLLAGWVRFRPDALQAPDNKGRFYFDSAITSRSCGCVVRARPHTGAGWDHEFSVINAVDFWEIIFYLERHKLL